NDVHQSDPVGAGRTGAQMGEGLAEADRGVDLQQKIGDACERYLLVKIEHQILGTVRCSGFKFFNMQDAVLDRPAGNRAHARGAAKLAQPDIEALLPICQPFLRPQWYSETAA